MDSTAPLLIFYARNDALGDGLLRLPALRAARTAFPQSHIVYGTMGNSSLTGVLRKHVASLIDDFRPVTPLSAVLAEFKPRGGQTTLVDFRTGVPGLLVTRLQLIGRGVRYEPNFAGYMLSWRPGIRWTLRPEHNAWRYHRLVERLAGRHLPFDHRLDVPQAARALARQLRGADQRPLILLGGNAKGNKFMGDAQVAAVAGNLIDAGYQVLYLVTPGSGPSPQTLAAKEPRLQLVGPELGLDAEAFSDLLLALGEMAAAYVGMEGGLGHLFATVMTPTVIINNGANMERWRPLSNTVEVVTAPRRGRSAKVSDTPAEAIIEATHRLLAASRRDHALPR
ncbi:glycosyltransferase family 9 protein [Mesorhizobium sp. M4B.F.Ca.ET.017.02.2.1]|uniref:glycosyltransferase family 9 protein n=1 Tax=Mesorhizobium sp. M4B.F.Ca.ET.017.02.2.1 TaxID=2496649 RepID=UPI000FCB8355|nr:glycosyltransferase family 9 protein [Mesorhizobium sp. M4B.F.Ca.ET.017.02.2.1]RVD30303.1 lipopolysaccharide heptosyltransferase family protein [Mesorhizobium sp. M4B.F.Ca.ET.017.02.2.1]